MPPVPDLWSRLPEDDDGLEQAAARYYGTGNLLPVAGSQAAIQALPRLRPPGRVGVIAPGYGEHAHAWRGPDTRSGRCRSTAIEAALPDLDVLVLIHPNNPTGARFPRADLLRWHGTLAARGGWLVVDEAFMDATPEESLADLSPRPGLIVLRSLGKFFGLAGARVGFVLADPAVTRPLAALLGPWTIAAPSRWVAAQALADTPLAGPRPGAPDRGRGAARRPARAVTVCRPRAAAPSSSGSPPSGRPRSTRPWPAPAS